MNVRGRGGIFSPSEVQLSARPLRWLRWLDRSVGVNGFLDYFFFSLLLLPPMTPILKHSFFFGILAWLDLSFLSHLAGRGLIMFPHSRACMCAHASCRWMRDRWRLATIPPPSNLFLFFPEGGGGRQNGMKGHQEGETEGRVAFLMECCRRKSLLISLPANGGCGCCGSCGGGRGGGGGLAVQTFCGAAFALGSGRRGRRIPLTFLHPLRS